MTACGYCGADLERIEVTPFGVGDEGRIYVDGYCSARCVIPTCVTCGRNLDTERRCVNLDCPIAFHRQFDLQETP